MTKWEYQRLVVWEDYPELVNKDGRGWYVEWKDRSRDTAYFLLSSNLYPGGGTPTRLPLKPEHDWAKVPARELFTWEEDAGYADLAMELINRLGAAGWELAGIQIAESSSMGSKSSHFWILKRPIE